jgi:membrane protein DedA with SNARE-associated domain
MIHEMLHQLLTTWFNWVDQWGYGGVFILMAMESSIIPVPSEIVLGPAAFWAAQGRMTLSGVIIAGTLGSYLGSTLCYWVSRGVGGVAIHRYGKWFFLSPERIEMAEGWLLKYGSGGIFFARLLPVVRHLISIPAGIFKMGFARFSTFTLLGAGLWCTVLSWFGSEVLGDQPDLLKSPEAMVEALKHKLSWVVVGILVFAILYFLMLRLGVLSKAANQAKVVPESPGSGSH